MTNVEAQNRKAGRKEYLRFVIRASSFVLALSFVLRHSSLPRIPNHLVGMIAGPHEGPAGDLLKAERSRQQRQFVELLRWQIPRDPHVLERRRQVLPQR